MTRNICYQDIWIKGVTLRKGDRECDSRYQIIKNYLETHKITKGKVLDFGANLGYFSFRLATDFPELHVTMIDYEPQLPALTEVNQLPNIELIHAYIPMEDLKEHLKSNEYDLIIAMSVFHHFEDPGQIINLFSSYSKTMICEIDYPLAQPISNPHLVKDIFYNVMSYYPVQINSKIKHDRPIYVISKDMRFNVLYGEIHSGDQMSPQTFSEMDPGLLEDFFDEKIFYGTLNIELGKKINLKKARCLAGVYRIYPMYLLGQPVHCIRPIAVKYPTNELEIVSCDHLRTKYGLNDGDMVPIWIKEEYMRDKNE